MPKMPTPLMSISQFREYARAYWGLISANIADAMYSGYPIEDTTPAIEHRLHHMQPLKLLEFMRNRSWVWIVDGKETYQITEAVLEAVPNYDQDVDEYMDRFVHKEFESFEVAWPYWEKQLELSMRTHEGLSDSQKIG